jgi:hypothetical protein
MLFAASGCAALIYEVVWLQLLQLVVGSTAVSMAVLLSAYMGGLCAGSYLLPRFVSPREHPLRVFAFIELGIALFGSSVLFLVPLVRYIYVAGIGLGVPGMLLRGLVAGLCLLPPTLLMGASLPAMARWVEATPQGVSRLGLLYGANTAGAVLGCLAAGFYLLRVFDMPTATFVAAGINGLTALASLALAARTPVVVRLADQGLGRGSGLDAAALAAARGDGVYVRDHSRGVSGGHRFGQRGGVAAGADGRAGSRGVWSLPVAACGVDCLDGVDRVCLIAVLADQSIAFAQSLDRFPTRPGAVSLGDAAGDDSLGRELSAGAGGRGARRRGFG